MEFLIACPLCLLAGFIDSIAGGGGLISVPAFLFAGLPVHTTLGTNKLQSSMGTAIATLRYARNGYIVPAFCIAGIACGLAGSAIGSNLVLITGDFAVRVLMLAALPLIAFYVLKTKSLNRNDDAAPHAKGIAITAAIALVIGMYDGFYGPGTGTFLMLALTGIGSQSLTQAAGTTKAINLATNVAALTVFLVNGQVLLVLGLTCGACSIVGNWLGAKWFTMRGSGIVRPIMIVVLVLFAIKLITDLLA